MATLENVWLLMLFFLPPPFSQEHNSPCFEKCRGLLFEFVGDLV